MTSRPLLVAFALLASSACGEVATRAVAPAPDRLGPNGPGLDAISAQADSLAKGYFNPRRVAQAPAPLAAAGAAVSVVSVTPGWQQGASQPNTIIAQFAGPVKSVTIASGASGDAILCSGNYGRLIAYDSQQNLVGDIPLSLIDPSDCGSDQVTFGAQATVTSSSAEIASILIIPMAPVTFPVNGVPGGRATATYAVQLVADPNPNLPPVAIPTMACYVATRACTFDASQSTDDHGIVSYKWDLGIGFAGKVTGKLVTFTYPNSASRMVTLTVTDAGGRSSTSATSFIFDWLSQPGGNYGPLASFNASCVALTCTFDSSSSWDDVGINGRAWFYGDGLGAGGNEQVIRHTYSAPGIYNVSLWVEDGGGAGQKVVKDVVVGVPNGVDAPPVASFTWNCASQALPHQCAFDASASKDDIGIVSYQWSWGNGRAETKVGPTSRNTWASSGTYSVQLIVTDTKGQTSSTQQFVYVP